MRALGLMALNEKFAKVYIEIGNICNFQCSFCPEVIREKKMMSIDLFSQVISQVAPLTEQVCLHLMGDPLVHPKLGQIIELCEQSQVQVNLVTNGYLLTDEKAEILLQNGIRQVNFSLHSFPDNYPDRDPSEYLNKIFKFAKRAFAIRPDLYLNFRLWNLNGPRGQHANNLRMLEIIEKEFNWKMPESIDVRKKKSLLVKNRLYMHYDTEFVWPDINLPVLGSKGFCYGLSTQLGILADGTVVPCCLDKEGKIPLGRIPQQRLADILAGPKASEILKGFQKRKLINPLCQRCNYIQRFGN